MAPSFTKHPHEVGETYGEHFMVASSFGWAMLVGSLGCFVHAFLPFLCTTTGSSTVRRLYDRMVTNRTRAKNPGSTVQA